MIPVKCPTCGRAFEVERIEDRPSFPFCSERCQMIDLGRWLDEEHAVPGPPGVPEGTEEAPPIPGSPPDEDREGE